MKSIEFKPLIIKSKNNNNNKKKENSILIPLKIKVKKFIHNESTKYNLQNKNTT